MSTSVPSNLKNLLEPSPTYILGLPPLYSNCIPSLPNVVLLIVNFLLVESKPIFVPLLISSASIVNPPISPSVAVTLPDIITSPVDFKWKFEELISNLPSLEPLMKAPAVSPLPDLPSRNADELTSKLFPSNLTKPPVDLPAKNLGVPLL